MTYKIHPGIVLLNICNTHMLVATRQFWEKFPRVHPLPPLWAAFWTLLEKGRTDQEVVSAFVRLFHMPEDTIKCRFEKMCQTLSEEGYLIPTEGDK